MLSFYFLLLVSKDPSDVLKKADSCFFAKNFTESALLYESAASGFLAKEDLASAATSLNDAGLSFFYQGRFNKAIFYYNRTLELDYKIGNEQNVAGRLRNIGIAYRKLGFQHFALKALNKALELSKEHNSEKTIASLSTSVGNVYLELESPLSAKQFFIEALTLYENFSNKKGIALSTHNIAITFQQLDDLDSSIVYFRNAIVLKKELQDSLSLAYSFEGLGASFLEKKDCDSAFFYFTWAYEIRKNNGELANLASTANFLAQYYLAIEQPKDAKPFLNEAYDYAQSENNRTVLMESLRLLNEYHKAMGHYNEAYKYLNQWSAMRDSVFNEEKLKVQQLQSQYDLEASEKERVKAEYNARQAEEQRSRAYYVAAALIAILAAISGFATIVYVQRRQLKKMSNRLKQQNTQIAALNKQNFHFVRNTMTENVSMLNVQIKSLEEGEVKEKLIAEKLRMETINILYQQLFLQPESTKVPLAPFLNSIVRNTIDVMLPVDTNTQVQFEMDDVSVSHQKALSMGMIVNEICLNACKYARKVEDFFKVSLKKQEDCLLVSLKDAGPGYTKKINKHSFGLRLIEVLAADLQSEYQVINTVNGLCYIFKIPT